MFASVPGDDSLAQAIRNVKRHFAVVGVMEEYEQLIDVLELTFPSYFRGMTEIYKAVGMYNFKDVSYDIASHA